MLNPKINKGALVSAAVVAAISIVGMFSSCGKKTPDEPTTVPVAQESAIEDITLTTASSNEKSSDNGIDSNLPDIDFDDEYEIISGYGLE